MKLVDRLSLLGLLEKPQAQADIQPQMNFGEGARCMSEPTTGGAVRAWHSRPPRADIERGVAQVRDGYCMRYGETYDSSGRRFANLSHKRRLTRRRAWINESIKQDHRFWLQPEPVDVAVLNLTASTAHMYYHWLVDVLPRYKLAQVSGNIANRWLYVDTNAAFQRQSLAALGLLGRTIDTAKNPLIQSPHIAVPAHQMADGYLPPRWVIEFLRLDLLPRLEVGSSPFGKRLYVSRNDATRRRIQNEDELMVKLSAFGFAKITLGDLTISDQASAFNAADTIIAAHGGAMANLVFANPGTTVIELFSDRYFDDGPFRLAEALMMPYFYVRARRATRGRPIEVDYEIDCADLLATMKVAGIK